MISGKMQVKKVVRFHNGDLYDYIYDGYIPIQEQELASKSLRYTLSLGVTAAIPPGELAFFTHAVQVARQDISISEEEISGLMDSSEGVTPLFTASM